MPGTRRGYGHLWQAPMLLLVLVDLACQSPVWTSCAVTSQVKKGLSAKYGRQDTLTPRKAPFSCTLQVKWSHLPPPLVWQWHQTSRYMTGFCRMFWHNMHRCLHYIKLSLWYHGQLYFFQAASSVNLYQASCYKSGLWRRSNSHIDRYFPHYANLRLPCRLLPIINNFSFLNPCLVVDARDSYVTHISVLPQNTSIF